MGIVYQGDGGEAPSEGRRLQCIRWGSEVEGDGLGFGGERDEAVDEGTPIDALQRGQIQFGLMMGWMGIGVWILLAIGFVKLASLGH